MGNWESLKLNLCHFECGLYGHKETVVTKNHHLSDRYASCHIDRSDGPRIDVPDRSAFFVIDECNESWRLDRFRMLDEARIPFEIRIGGSGDPRDCETITLTFKDPPWRGAHGRPRVKSQRSRP